MSSDLNNNISNEFVTFIGSEKSVFVSRTKDYLEENGYLIQMFEPINPLIFTNRRGLFFRIIRLVVRFLLYAKKILFQSSGKTVVIHALTPNIVFLSFLLKAKYRKVIVIAYGSDVLRRNKQFDKYLRSSLKFVDVVAATNTNVIKELTNSFENLEGKTALIRFGLPVFDAIDRLDRSGLDKRAAKTSLGLNPDEIVVCIGYCASRGQRQLEVIQYIEEHYQLFSGLQLLVPIQYGKKDLISEVESRCDEIPFLKPISTFYDTEKTAILRLATDILINHSISDSFSGTVQEVLYSGGRVLYQQTLPYANMPGYKTQLTPYSSLDEMTEMLSFSLVEKPTNNSSHLQNLKAELSNISGWKAVLPAWKDLLGT